MPHKTKAAVILSAIALAIAASFFLFHVTYSQKAKELKALRLFLTAPPNLPGREIPGLSSTNILSTMSPKLRQFLADHPEASGVFSNALSEVLGSRSVSMYYYYSTEETSEAWHYYPNDYTVGIVVRENQQPCDEFMCLIYEVVNCEGEDRYRQSWDEARAKRISKEKFVREIMLQEFQATQKTQAIISNLKLTKEEISHSVTYRRFISCPGSFSEFLSQQLKVPKPSNLLRKYGDAYDAF